MKEIIDTYIENAFDGSGQALFKLNQFELNYRKYFPADTSSPVLDIGIGRGEMLTAMKNWGYLNYLGIDISPSTVKFCKEFNLNCEVVDNAAKWTAAHKNKFAVITLLDVLEHVPRTEMIEFVSSLKEGLAEGGTLIIQTPNMQAPDAQLHRYNDITHEFGFVAHSLNQVLMTAGFKNVEIFGFEDIVFDNYKKHIQKYIRAAYWKTVRFTRLITNNLNPDILNPVFFAAAKK